MIAIRDKYIEARVEAVRRARGYKTTSRAARDILMEHFAVKDAIPGMAPHRSAAGGQGDSSNESGKSGVSNANSNHIPQPW